MSAVVSIRDAVVEFPVKGGVIRAVDGVNLDVFPGETVAVVGESGCGKTTLARAVLGLQPLARGEVRLGDTTVRGVLPKMASRVGMVWQDPYASLNPKWTIARSITETLRLTDKAGSAEDILRLVGLDDWFATRYPHELSGGQRQRVAIGRALAPRPPLVICDEPTAALDLSIRAQILNLLKDIQQQERCALLYISHDLTTVRYLADRIAVMYMGIVVESGPTEDVFLRPRHPYTKALLESAPTLDKLMYLPEPIEGEIPDPRHLPAGCRFSSRCPNATETCHSAPPGPTTEGDRTFFCYHPVS